ncbi:hypothetical protein E0W68_11675 [Flavobacterium salilacus subsp. salilacus]|uniref:hypothetical protein n=1 Tax=Flavobacterium TaxID=237 RepID=UPI0010751A22|nr:MULTISPECIES: hypothetical protein [Flavobacterium]KAF2516868.1 hypothetical protein E0W68_11675 [Flavobacterium salilacus subsp. salilacus]MBE1615773.1 hypothetical protein [Flavobacterium sp. SaA2.13]
MKKLFLIYFLLLSLQAFSQNQKDLLLERDHAMVIERLQFMDYLNDATMKLKWHIKKAGDTLRMPFYAYYNDSIVARNPVPSTNISSYLDYQPNQAPPSAGEFTMKVYNTNAATLYNIIKRYGYPSTSKLDKYEKRDPLRNAIIILMASKAWKEILRPVIETENNNKNLTKHEYWFCDLAFKQDLWWGQDVDEHLKSLKKKDADKN